MKERQTWQSYKERQNDERIGKRESAQCTGTNSQKSGSKSFGSQDASTSSSKPKWQTLTFNFLN